MWVAVTPDGRTGVALGKAELAALLRFTSSEAHRKELAGVSVATDAIRATDGGRALRWRPAGAGAQRSGKIVASAAFAPAGDLERLRTLLRAKEVAFLPYGQGMPLGIFTADGDGTLLEEVEALGATTTSTTKYPTFDTIFDAAPVPEGAVLVAPRHLKEIAGVTTFGYASVELSMGGRMDRVLFRARGGAESPVAGPGTGDLVLLVMPCATSAG